MSSNVVGTWPSHPPWVRAGSHPWAGPLDASCGGTAVWSCRLPAGRGLLRACCDALSAEESARAARFVAVRAGELYRLSHGLLRLLLGASLGVRPGTLAFREGRWGKPGLVGASLLQFNIAHSGERVLLAFSRDGEVGVDIERRRALGDCQDMAERFFCSRESAALRALEPGAREAAFFRLWTRKEAMVKAAGLSVARYSREAEALPAEEGPAEGTWAVPLSAAAGELSVRWRDLPAPSGYSAAIAGTQLGAVSLRELDSDA